MTFRKYLLSCFYIIKNFCPGIKNLLKIIFSNKNLAVLLLITFITLILSSLFIYSKYFQKTTYKIAYIGVGMHSSPYNQLNRWLLQKKLDKININSNDIELQLYVPGLKENKIYAYVDKQVQKENEDQFVGMYENLMSNPDVILIVDNTWRMHLALSKKVINKQESKTPIISLNGDKGSKYFYNKVMFLGSDDFTHKKILSYINNVLNKQLVIFISEDTYPLHNHFIDDSNGLINKSNTCHIYERNYQKNFDDEIIEQIECKGIDSSNKNMSVTSYISSKVEEFIKSGGNGFKDTVIILNVHSHYGNAIIKELNSYDSGKSFDDLVMIGGSYVVGSKNKYVINNTKLFLLTRPLDAVPNSLYHDIEQFFSENDGIERSSISNTPLFSERIDIASQLIDFVVNNKSKLDQFSPFFGQLRNKVIDINANDNKKESKNKKKAHKLKNSELAKFAHSPQLLRELYTNIFIHTAKKRQLILNDQILNFDEKLILMGNTSFEQRNKYGIRSTLSQLNNDYDVIPNFNFKISNLKIINISQETKTFTADFLVWVNSPCDIFQKNTDNNCLSTSKENSINNEAGYTQNSDDTFGLLKDYIRFENLVKFIRDPFIYREKHKEGIHSYVIKISAEFNTQFTYHNFPLDEQELVIAMNITGTPDKVRVSQDRTTVQSEKKHFLNSKNIFGWLPTDYYYTVDRKIADFSINENGMSDISKTTFQSISLRIPIKRKLMKPLILVITPILMIGLASISVLYLSKLTFEGAGEVSVVIFLALITYSLSIVDVVPAIETTTKAHILFFITFALVVLVFLYIVYKNSYFLSPDSYDIVDNGRSSHNFSAFITISYLVAVAFTLYFY